jgi:8-oxo-dGTP pyrophosphatase MutT (NUDIX family)
MIPGEITCLDRYGNPHAVMSGEVRFRVSVAGLLADESGKLLLVRDHRTGQWEVPGGGVDTGESIEDSLVREFQEETGLLVKPTRLVTYAEDTYYLDYEHTCYHSVRLFFSVLRIDADQLPAAGEYLDWLELRDEDVNEIAKRGLRRLGGGMMPNP